MTLCTSNHTYKLLSFCELSKKQQAESRRAFDWVEDIDSSCGFFVYENEVYELGSFMRHNAFLLDEKTGKKFYAHGVYNLSAFNGLAVAFVNNNEAVNVAYFS